MTTATPELLMPDQRKQKVYTLLVKMHRAYGKQKNKVYTDNKKKEQFSGGYDALKSTIMVFNNVPNLDDLKSKVKKEAQRYKKLAEVENLDDKDYSKNLGMYKAFKQIIAGIIYIDELDVDSHHVLRTEIINFDYA